MDDIEKVILYADDTPYQVIDLKNIDSLSEEEYNDKLKDAWFKKTHYETVEELTMSKYYNYTIDEVEEEKPKKKINWHDIILVSLTYAIFIGVGIFLVWLILRGG